MQLAATPDVYDERIKQLVRDSGLPPSPRIVARLLALTRRKTYSTREVTDLIGSDAAFTAAVIAIANADAGTRPLNEHVSTAADALNRLGIRAAVHLLTELLSRGAFPYSDDLRFGAAWACNAKMAAVASQLAYALAAESSERARTYAVLRDCGFMCLLPCLTSDSDSFVELTWSTRSVSGSAALDDEDARFGVNHARAGALLAQSLGIDADLVEAIRDHHRFEPRINGTATATCTRTLVAIGLLADEIIARAWDGRSCTHWADAQSFVKSALGLSDTGLYSALNDPAAVEGARSGEF